MSRILSVISGGGKAKTALGRLEQARAYKKKADQVKGMQNGGSKGESQDERYKKLLAEKLENIKHEMAVKDKRSSFHIQGTRMADKNMSESTKRMLEKMAEMQAQKELKRIKAKETEIKPAFIGGRYGGTIDKKGAVRNGFGQQVLQIDPKTGDILTMGFFGRKVGKYDPKSYNCFHKMAKEIEKFATKKGLNRNQTNIWGAQLYPDKPTGTIWGSSADSGSGGIWGSGGGGIWGNNE